MRLMFNIKNTMGNITDFEISKKELAKRVALVVEAFVKEHGLDSISVSAFITDSDASVTEIGNVEYGRMIHCIVDACMVGEESGDYD